MRRWLKEVLAQTWPEALFIGLGTIASAFLAVEAVQIVGGRRGQIAGVLVLAGLIAFLVLTCGRRAFRR